MRDQCGQTKWESDQSAVRSWHYRLNMFFYWTRFIWQKCAVR